MVKAEYQLCRTHTRASGIRTECLALPRDNELQEVVLWRVLESGMARDAHVASQVAAEDRAGAHSVDPSLYGIGLFCHYLIF